MGLWRDFQCNTGRTIHKWSHYFPVYERHFSSFINRPITFLEIGCGDGGSLQMWRRYLGPYAQFVGLDIRPECKNFEGDQIQVRIGNQADTAFLDGIIAEFGVPDIIVDDGSHAMSDVCTTFSHLYRQMRSTGVYLVEDLHTAYWPQYGGGLRRQGTFIEMTKNLIDELNADLSEGALEPTEFTRTTNAICVYNSIVVLERGLPLPKRSLLVGSTGYFGAHPIPDAGAAQPEA
ncbi:class I SAM-dependent methyltransferase [Methylobacterium sp. J-076]|uniref:class I SAM-dependent methyltransferase n=1 Tax=Methylobacterium sp. J-076 TaxID=2836655 RepID=UPI001FBB1FE6|nr:class I SAM-dependent methyltransferase [Methylobacterium sp. J-076]MCJ2011819.1 class I SAM-dependent methyltransferase [Methylobacterium sp. J-076]